MYAAKLRALSTKKKRMVYSTSQQLLNPNNRTDIRANSNTTEPTEALKANYNERKSYGNANISNLKQHVKPLIVLDVNGILCHRYRKRDIPQDISSAIKNASMKELFPSEDEGNTSYITSIRQRFYRDSIANIAKTPIIPRSDLKHFLRLLNDHFTLAVWTSAKEANANSLVDVLFPTDIVRQLLFIWNQDQCDVDRDDNARQGVVNNNIVTSDHSNSTNVSEIATKKNEMVAPTIHRKQPYRKVIYIKRIQKVWDEYPLFNKSNTLLIDDSPEKCPVEYKLNTLHPPPIFGLNQVALESLVLSTHYNLDTESSNLNDDQGHHRLSFDQYSDELNQQRQFLFFQRLAKHWESRSLCTEDDECQHLERFLEQYGKTHMNWRG